MRRSISRLLIGLFAAPLMMISSAASAGTNPCGNIELAATGSCEYEVSGGCQADCTPLSFVAACDGQCTIDASVECTGGCTASCETECNLKPATFECEGSCNASCESSCSATCSDASCKASCSASCNNRCNIDCVATPPSATCEAKCKASCDASCKVQANADCSVSCASELKGGCEVQCDTPKGALFCNGQYVNAASDVDACAAYLEQRGFGFSVTADCTGGECTASVGCAAAPAGAVDDRLGVGAIAGMMVGLGMIVSRRRRRA